MKRIITYSIIALLQASVSLAQTSVSLAKTPVSLAQTPSKPKLQKREKYEWQGEIPTYVETLKKVLPTPAWPVMSCTISQHCSCLNPCGFRISNSSVSAFR